ncbi:hypothetical protein V8B97DRAFT_2002943 [Scleroderma yunnanense]
MGEHTGLVTATHEVSDNAQPVQTTVKDIEDAEKKILTIETIPGPVGSAVNATGFADTAMTKLNTINTMYLQPINAFNVVVSGIANIHPYAQMALTVLTTASNLILLQVNINSSIGELVIRIRQTYRLILENKSPSRINAMKDVLAEIAQVVQECAQFMAKYLESKNFWLRLGKNVFSETNIKVANYNLKLDKLMQEF